MITLFLDEFGKVTPEIQEAHRQINERYAEKMANKWEIRYNKKPFVNGHDWDYHIEDDERCYTAPTYDAAVSFILIEHEDIGE